MNRNALKLALTNLRRRRGAGDSATTVEKPTHEESAPNPSDVQITITGPGSEDKEIYGWASEDEPELPGIDAQERKRRRAQND